MFEIAPAFSSSQVVVWRRFLVWSHKFQFCCFSWWRKVSLCLPFNTLKASNLFTLNSGTFNFTCHFCRSQPLSAQQSASGWEESAEAASLEHARKIVVVNKVETIAMQIRSLEQWFESTSRHYSHCEPTKHLRLHLSCQKTTTTTPTMRIRRANNNLLLLLLLLLVREQSKSKWLWLDNTHTNIDRETETETQKRIHFLSFPLDNNKQHSNPLTI